MSDRKVIQIDPRAYNLIKSSTITSVTEALVELVTNSDDAYQNLGGTGPFEIDIEVDYSGFGAYGGCISVRDDAGGMTGEKLETVMTLVGGMSTEQLQRGFFSRGAKDCSAIGDITFHTIKDGLYSSITIFSDSTYKMNTTSAPVTDAQREALGIPGNGTKVNLRVLQSIGIPPYDYFQTIFHKTLSLRNIFSSPMHKVTLSLKNHITKPDVTEQLSYEFKEGNLLMDLVFDVPRYPGSTVHFQMFKSETLLDDEMVGRIYKEHGFIVSSGVVIHDIFDFSREFKNDPNLKYIFGSIHSDTINDLLHSFDIRNNDPKNPFLILNPDRVSGINQQHPFIVNVTRMILPKLRDVISLLSLTSDVSTVDVINMDAFSELAEALNLTKSAVVGGPTHEVTVQRPTGKYIRNGDLAGEEMPRSYRVLRDFTVQLENTNLPKEIFPTIRMTPTTALRGRYTIERNDVPPKTEYSLYELAEDAVDHARVVEFFGSTRLDIVKEEDMREGETKMNDVYVNRMSRTFQVVFRKDNPLTHKYVIEPTKGGLRIVINADNPTLSTFLTSTTVIDETVSSKALILLNETLTSAFSRLLTEEELGSFKGKSLLNATLTPNEIAHNVFSLYDSMVDKVEGLVFEVTKKILAQRKLAKLSQ